MKNFALFLLLATASAHGQTTTSESVLPLEKIGPDDLVSVNVSDLPQLSRTFRVGPDGHLNLPVLKGRVKAAGMLPSELEQAIMTALMQEAILVEPIVTVGIAEYRSRPVSVVGAVKRPTTFQALGHVTLLDALTKADGLGPEAGHEILVTGPTRDGSSERTVRRIPVRELIEKADPTLNPRLYGGEEIRVPEAGRVYVVGNVRKPGMFPVNDGAESTLLKMLALCEGTMPYTAKKAFIYREAPGGQGRKELPVELSQIMSRKAPDVALQPDDILYIPDSKSKRVTLTTLEKLAGFGASTASGVLIWRGR
jgi:polysaccharide biosynthesis/export protein